MKILLVSILILHIKPINVAEITSLTINGKISINSWKAKRDFRVFKQELDSEFVLPSDRRSQPS